MRTVEIQTLSATEETVKLYDFLRTLVFRRVSHVDYKNNVKFHRVYELDEVYTDYPAGQLPNDVFERNKDWLEKHVENFASSFKLLTQAKPMLKNDMFQCKLFAHSSRFHTFDPVTFTHSSTQTLKVVPYSGNLICGEVDVDKHGAPYYVWWTLCSEQFMRMAVCLLHGEDHPLIQSLRFAPSTGDMEPVRRALMRGNRLTVSSNVHKRVLVNAHNSLPPPSHNELVAGYARTRGEWITRSDKYLHYYNAIVMMLVYNEMPCVYNIPNNINELQLKEWVVPPEVLKGFMTKFGIVITGVKIVNEPEEGETVAEETATVSSGTATVSSGTATVPVSETAPVSGVPVSESGTPLLSPELVCPPAPRLDARESQE